MDHKITIQPTPNPNALKFVVNAVVKSKDSAVYKKGAATDCNPLAAFLLALPNVTEVYFANHFITVTQDGSADWDALEVKVKDIISANIAAHNPDFDTSLPVKSASGISGDLAKIEQILDANIRPALQRDGGDLQVVSLDGKILTIDYQGACGCCPHAAMGTLYAIQNVLRDQYDPEIVVEMG
ncbi:MAG: NifU family protein [Candidatus Omnitrophica bacterium]|nr:NifU family protein [Candidatus Omnitrophota bacterium]